MERTLGLAGTWTATALVFIGWAMNIMSLDWTIGSRLIGVGVAILVMMLLGALLHNAVCFISEQSDQE